MTVRATIVVRRIDAAIASEVKVVRAAIVRRSRPIVAAATDTDQTAIVVVAITRSRIPYSRCATEFTREVYALVGTIVSVRESGT